MKNIIKYVVISFGILFLSSFLFVEKTYGYGCVTQCPDDCSCDYFGRCIIDKVCTCSNEDDCGCGGPSAWPTCACTSCPPPTPCPTVAYIENCKARGCTGAICDSCTGCPTGGGGGGSGGSKKCNNVTCISGVTTCGSDGYCFCRPLCTYGCETDGSCSTSSYNTPLQCKNLISCENNKVYVYDSSIGACICVDDINWEPEPSECDCTGADCAGAVASYSCPAGEHAGVIAATTGCYMLTCVDDGSVVDVGGGDDGEGGDVCFDTDCNPTDYCEPNGWVPVSISSESLLLEDIVTCTSRINCEDVETTGDCYEDPNIECTSDTDCEGGECCRGYTCTTDCTPVVLCNTDSECGTNKCCVGGECGKCLSDDSQTLKLTIGSKISNTVVVSIWDRVLAMFRKLNTYLY